MLGVTVLGAVVLFVFGYRHYRATIATRTRNYMLSSWGCREPLCTPYPVLLGSLLSAEGTFSFQIQLITAQVLSLID